jgi:small-conductance mechanosensitive channel
MLWFDVIVEERVLMAPQRWPCEVSWEGNMRISSLFFLIALFVFGLIAVPGVHAQLTASETAPSPEVVSELASKLTPDQSAALVKMLEVLARENEAVASDVMAKPNFMEIVRTSVTEFGDRIRTNITGAPEMIGGWFRAFIEIFSGRGVSGSFSLLGMLVIVLGVGFGGNYLVSRLAKPLRDRIRDERPETFIGQLKTLSLRLGLELSGLLAFIVLAVICARLIVVDPSDQAIIISLLLTIILITRLTSAFLRFVLGPTRPDLRLVAADDWTAQFIFRSLVGLAALIGVGFFSLGLFERYSIPVTDTFRFWIGLIVVGWIIYVTWRARGGLTIIIKGEEANLTPGLERMATWWPTVSIVVVVFTWLLIQLAASAGLTISPARAALALAIIVAAPFLDTMVRGIVRHMVPPMEGEGPVAEEAYNETRFSYVRIARVFMFAVLILAVGRLLGINFGNLAEAGLGAQIAANGVGFLLVLAIGYIAWEISNLWVNRQLAREHPPEVVDTETETEGGAHSKSRMASVLPLVHMTLQITIITITVLLALSQLGFNITPLLAGAGVLGLAIGFGAQTLVKDIVSGVFFLLDDAFRVGEYIDVGGTLGAVEKISVRSLQLRGARGPVHIVPYGSISKLTNHSRDWVIMKLRFTVPFGTDMEKVRKIFKKIGQEIMQNPEHAENLLSPFKSQGVAEFDDVGIVVRGKFTAKPGTQFVIRKEIFTRVQEAFDENGIEFARKEVKVQIPGLKGDQSLSAEQKDAVAAAAAEAAEPKPVAS